MQIGCSVNNDVGGAEMEIETQIRGIDGVTTVKSIPDMKRPLTPQADYNVFEIKFEILGAQNRVDFRDKVIFPKLRLIPGINIVDWSPIHRTNVRGTIRTVRENKNLNEWGIAGGAIGITRNSPHGKMNTPRMSLDDILKDWEEGVKVFDIPVNTNDMSYHVMMPVKELEPFMSRIYRADKITFDGRYRQFIETGPTMPVYLAVGRGGRVKVTGNEDILWFAKRSGLEEVPVIINYQRQI